MSDSKRAPLSGSEAVAPPTDIQSESADAQGQFSAAVDDLLDQLQNKFNNVSKEMFGKLDDMTRRLDELESSLKASEDSGSSSPTK